MVSGWLTPPFTSLKQQLFLIPKLWVHGGMWRDCVRCGSSCWQKLYFLDTFLPWNMFNAKGRGWVKSSPPHHLISSTLLSVQRSLINQRNSSSIWLTLNSSLPHDLGTFSWPFVTFLILHRARGWNQGCFSWVELSEMHLSWHLSWSLLSAALSAFERMCPRRQPNGECTAWIHCRGSAIRTYKAKHLWAQTLLCVVPRPLWHLYVISKKHGGAVEETAFGYWSVSMANVPNICPLSYTSPLMLRGERFYQKKGKIIAPISQCFHYS